MIKDLNDIFTDIDDKLIAQAKPEAQKPLELRSSSAGRFSWKKPVACAAAVCVTAGAVFGGFGIKNAIEAAGRQERHIELGHYDNDGGAAKVFESYGLNAANCNIAFTMEEFPDRSFDLDERGVCVHLNNDEEGIEVIKGAPLKSVYLYDATGDGLRDMCITHEVGTKNFIRVYDIAADKIYKISDKVENYRIGGAMDMEYTYTLVPEGFAGTKVPEGELCIFAYGGNDKRKLPMSLNDDEYAFWPDKITDNTKLETEDLLADWDRCDPVELWTNSDIKKIISLPKFNMNMIVSDTALEIFEDGVPVEFTNINYRNGNILRYNSVYSGDVDLDGKCELIVGCDLDQFVTGKVFKCIIVYDLDARQTQTIDSRYEMLLRFEDGALQYRYADEYNEWTIICSHHIHWWENVWRVLMEYENKGAYWEDFSIPQELDISKTIGGGEYEFEMASFPGRRFCVTSDSRIIDSDGKVIIEAPTLKNGFLYDYNSDGKQDICVTAGINGVYYIEIYDVENGVNKYLCSKKTEKDSRYLTVSNYGIPVLEVRGIIGGGYYGTLAENECTDTKPTLEELLLLCDGEKMSAGTVYDFSVNGTTMSFTGKGGSASLCRKEKIFTGVRNVPIFDNVLSACLCDTDGDGASEIWMTYLDGDRVSVAAYILGGANTLYVSPNDGVSRRLEIDADAMNIFIDNGISREPLDLGKLIKRDLS